MAWKDSIRERFRAGEVNQIWGFIQLVKQEFEKTGSDVELIDHLEEVLLQYAQIKPWPFVEGDEVEEIDVRFFRSEHADFFFYLGMGMAMASMLDEKVPETDIESQIVKNCIGKYDTYQLQKAEVLHTRKLLLIEFLEGHVGENPTRKVMHEVTMLDMDSIRVMIDLFVDRGILEFGKNRVILKFDANAARELVG